MKKDGCPPGMKYDYDFEECVPRKATKVRIDMIVPDDDYKNYESWIDNVSSFGIKLLNVTEKEV